MKKVLTGLGIFIFTIFIMFNVSFATENKEENKIYASNSVIIKEETEEENKEGFKEGDKKNNEEQDNEEQDDEEPISTQSDIKGSCEQKTEKEIGFNETKNKNTFGSNDFYVLAPTWMDEDQRSDSFFVFTITILKYDDEEPTGEWWEIKDSNGLIGYKDSFDIYIKAPENKPIKLAEDSSNMFSNFLSVQEIKNLDYLDTSNVKNMNGMFAGSGFLGLDLHTFDTSKVENMNSMFAGCSFLQDVYTSSFDTSKVTDMGSMFKSCGRLSDLRLGSFDTAKVKNMEQMFSGCDELQRIRVSDKFVVAADTTTTDMFNGCKKLKGGAESKYDEKFIDGEYARIDSETTPGYFTREIKEERNIKEIQIIKYQTKKEYRAAEEFDLSGLELMVIYDDGTQEKVEYDKAKSEFSMALSTVYQSTKEVIVFFRNAQIVIKDFTVGAPDQTTIQKIKTLNLPKKLEYEEEELFNPSNLKIAVEYPMGIINVEYNEQTKKDFSFVPSLETKLTTNIKTIKINYFGKTANIDITVYNKTSNYTKKSSDNDYGRNSSSSNSAITTGGVQNGLSNGNSVDVSLDQIIKEGTQNKVIVDSNRLPIAVFLNGTDEWIKDPNTGKYKLMGVDNFGNPTPISNGFANVARKIQSGEKESIVNDTYFFDASGNMVTGWMQTNDLKWYYFDTSKNENEGKMAIGWKNIGGNWHYFTENGSMLIGNITPDGYSIDVSGKWIA